VLCAGSRYNISEIVKQEEGQLRTGLYVVATPLGNLEDFTLRGLKILHKADIIACEDTRVTGKLLELIGADKKKLISCHNFNEAESAEKIIHAVKAGYAVALVSDAGTPLISDPGYRVISALRAAECSVFVVPGVSALTATACIAGEPTDRLYFIGFAPKTAGKRKKLFAEIQTQNTSFIFFERAERTPDLIAELDEFFPNARYFVARELTKKFETFYRGSAKTISEAIRNAPSFKGEVTLLLAPSAQENAENAETYDDSAIIALLQERLRAGEKLKAASESVALQTGRNKKDVYQIGALHKNLSQGET
jgi:16S rRNA (cytidine1402-2'-O)-methyltransferase